ncbi:hypothetical protein DNK10_20590 [Pseudomonas daroniae]|nr:hypothetical protein DNK10_20590 [Pseudomonas daroniae]
MVVDNNQQDAFIARQPIFKRARRVIAYGQPDTTRALSPASDDPDTQHVADISPVFVDCSVKSPTTFDLPIRPACLSVLVQHRRLRRARLLARKINGFERAQEHSNLGFDLFLGHLSDIRYSSVPGFAQKIQNDGWPRLLPKPRKDQEHQQQRLAA